MVRRRSFPSGWYGDALPDGSYAVLITGSHLATSRGDVALPSGQNLLFLRLAQDGRIAGIGHQPPVQDRALLFDGHGWSDHGLAFGPHAVIFDAAGNLVVKHDAPASGYRYVEDGTGRLVTASGTYADPVRQVWEYTTHGDITIGQGGDQIGHGDDPCIVLYQGKRYLLSEGRCRSIRFHRDGDRLSVAMSREDHNECLCVWLTEAEIATLPEITASVPTPPPTPKPPIPKPEPVPMPEIPNSLSVVKAAREKYAALSGRERAYRIVNQVAWDLRDLGAGTFYKPGGDGFADRSSDVIIFRPNGETFDILGDAEGDAKPQWGRTQPTGFGALDKWRAPVDPASLEPAPTPNPEPPPTPQPEPQEPTPVPTPTPTPAPACTCAEDVRKLNARFDALETLIKRSRKVTFKAGWPVGTVTGEVEGL